MRLRAGFQESEDYIHDQGPAGRGLLPPLQPPLKLNPLDNIEIGPSRASGRLSHSARRFRTLSSNVAEFSMSPEQFRAPRAPECRLQLSAPMQQPRKPLSFDGLDSFAVTNRRKQTLETKVPSGKLEPPFVPQSPTLLEPAVRGSSQIATKPFNEIWQPQFSSVITLPNSKPIGQSVRQKHQCGVCKKWYVNLGTHSLTHADRRPFRCVHCSREFSRSNDLLRHKRIHESSVFRCPYWYQKSCHPTGKFTRIDTYKRHMMAIHFVVPENSDTRKRQHASGKCSLCGVSFPSANTWLSEHIEKARCQGTTVKLN